MSAVSAPTPEKLSIREFARRDGCDESRVRRGIRSGHLKPLADGNLDAALVGTGWREGNRRRASRADTADTAAERLRTPHRGSAVAAEAMRDTLMLVSMSVGPSGMHPVAVDLSAMVHGAALDAAPILLRHLPLVTAQQIVQELTTFAIRAAVELLDDDHIAPPPGMASWTKHPSFAGPNMSELDWAEAVDLAAAGAQAGGAVPDA